MSEINRTKLPGFPLGVISNLNNQAEFPEQALANGENVKLTNGVSTRGGTSITSSGSLPAGEVVFAKQVRFPTNETSYMLVQVNTGWGQPFVVPRREHLTAYDSTRNLFMVWGGRNIPDETTREERKIFFYDPVSDTWTTEDMASEDPVERRNTFMVYDPDGDRMLVVNGMTINYDYPVDTIAYNCASKTWETLDTTGDAPPKFDNIWGASYCAARKSLLIYGNYRTPYPYLAYQENLFELDLTTLVWVKHDGAGLGTIYQDRVQDGCGVYVAANDSYYIFGGCTYWNGTFLKGCFQYSFSSSNWQQLPDAPHLIHSISAAAYGSKIYFYGGFTATVPHDPVPNFFSFDVDTGSWVTESCPHELDAGWSTLTFGASGGMLLCGGGHGESWCEPTPCYYGGGASGLYASPDHLPSETAEFTHIYSLGAGAGTVSAAVLNDRCVITEGINHPPLVWGGALEPDASDWMYPKQVLVTQDGNYFYDISSQVLDKDMDNSAGVGNIQSSGYIAVCCDVPKIRAFYVEMDQPNTVDSDAQHTIQQDIAFIDGSSIDQENFSRGCDRWRLFTGNKGYFQFPECAITAVENSSSIEAGSVKLTVPNKNYYNGTAMRRVEVSGTTNYNGFFTEKYNAGLLTDATHSAITKAYVPESFTETAKIRGIARSRYVWPLSNPQPEGDIVEGLRVVTTSGETTIKGFIAIQDGTYDLQTELYDNIPTSQLQGIYALDVAQNKVTVHQHQVTQTYTTTLNLDTINTKTYARNSFLGYNGFTVRQVIDGADLGTGGQFIKVTLTGGLSEIFRTYTLQIVGVRISRVSIVERDGQTANGIGTPIEITFNGGRSGVNLGLNQRVTSDQVLFSVSNTKQYLLIIDVAKSAEVYNIGYGAEQTTPVGFSDVVPYNLMKYSKYCGLGVYRVTQGNGFYVEGTRCDSPDPAKTSSWDANVSGRTFRDYTKQPGVDGLYAGLYKIEVASTLPTPVGTFAATTNDSSCIELLNPDSFHSVTVSESKPGNSTIYYTVSFDAQNTFKVFKNGAWKETAKLNGSAWQYHNGTSWVNATKNSKFGALVQANGVIGNRMTGDELGAITADQWSASGGIVLGFTQALHFGFCLTPDGTNVPTLYGFRASMLNYGSTTVEVLKSEGWQTGKWTDNTEINGASLGKTGTITYDDGECVADYGIVSEVPGFWFRFKTNGTSAQTAITRLMYQADCQPLQNIGDGQPSMSIGFIYVDSSTGATQDYTSIVSDYTESDIYAAELQLAPDDFLYIGGALRFCATDLIVYKPNTTPSVLSAQYWDGGAWIDLVITDGTSVSGKTFATSEKVSWSIPDNWKTCIPFGTFMSRGYWIRLKVSALLSEETSMSECRLFEVPNKLPKYRFAETFGNRIVLGNRPDAADQIDMSRPLEEYGFCGELSASYRVGGQDGIQCVMSAWNSLWIGKTENWHQVKETSNGFQVESVESARNIPISSRVVVKAPVYGFGDGNRYGLYFLNRYGAFISTGLHVDGLWNSSRGRSMSDQVNWWNAKSGLRLDLDHLDCACGDFLPRRNWIVWAVPMLEPGTEKQERNNYLLVYDLSLRAWQTPFRLPAASLCLGYKYSASGPAHIGDALLLAGDYQGRMLTLFDGESGSDNGSPISGWAQTGLLSFGTRNTIKLIRRLGLLGETENPISVEFRVDGNQKPAYVFEVGPLNSAVNPLYCSIRESVNVSGRYHQLTFRLPGRGALYGVLVDVGMVRKG